MISSDVVQGNVSINLNPSQPLNQLRVRIDTDRVKTADNGHLFIYDIRTEGKVYVLPTLFQSSYRFFKNIDSVDLSAIVSNVGGAEEANSIAIDPPHPTDPTKERYMYVVGFEPGKWRIEKRNLEDGYRVQSVTLDSGGGAAKAIAVDSFNPDPAKKRYMYVAGDDYSGGNYKWRIEKRDLETLELDGGFGENKDGVVISDPSDGNDSAYAIAIDPFDPTDPARERYLYVVGSDRFNGSSNAQWRIEKRKVSDGELVLPVALSNPSVDDDVPLAIAIDPYQAAERFMYVVGYDRSPRTVVGTKKNSKSSSYAEWRIEKRPLSDPATLTKFVTSNRPQCLCQRSCR